MRLLALLLLVACADDAVTPAPSHPEHRAVLDAWLAPVDSPLPTWAQLDAMGSGMDTALSETCQDSSQRSFVRANAAYLLGHYASDPTHADLLRTLADNTTLPAHIRARAIDGLALDPGARADSITHLRRWLTDGSDTVVISAVRAAQEEPALAADLTKLATSAALSPAVRPFLAQ